MLAISGNPDHLIISCNYDPTGLAAVDLFDNPVLGWLVDETSVVASLKPSDPVPPMGEIPIITGTMPPPATGTGAIASPQWAHFAAESVYVPDAWRGTLVDFFGWLATNNGARRKVRANFRSPRLDGAMRMWAQQNPSLFNSAPF